MTLTLTRDPGPPAAGFGFSFAGGADQQGEEDLAVCKVDVVGEASASGLRPGDLILRCNGRDLAGATHLEAGDWIKSRGDKLELVVERLHFVI